MARTDEQGVWDIARLSFDTQLRLLERTDQTGQALVAAATLSGSLAAPLLVLGLPNRLWVLLVFGLLLMLYMVTLGFALRSALTLLFASSGHRPPGRGFLHYSHIVSYTTVEELGIAIQAAAGSNQGADGLLNDIKAIAQILELKARRIDKTVFRVQVSYVALALLVTFRFITSAF